MSASLVAVSDFVILAVGIAMVVVVIVVAVIVAVITNRDD